MRAANCNTTVSGVFGMRKPTPLFSVMVSVIPVDLIFVGFIVKISIQHSSEGIAHSRSRELQPPNLLIK